MTHDTYVHAFWPPLQIPSPLQWKIPRTDTAQVQPFFIVFSMTQPVIEPMSTQFQGGHR